MAAPVVAPTVFGCSAEQAAPDACSESSTGNLAITSWVSSSQGSKDLLNWYSDTPSATSCNEPKIAERPLSKLKYSMFLKNNTYGAGGKAATMKEQENTFNDMFSRFAKDTGEVKTTAHHPQCDGVCRYKVGDETYQTKVKLLSTLLDSVKTWGGPAALSDLQVLLVTETYGESLEPICLGRHCWTPTTKTGRGTCELTDESVLFIRCVVSDDKDADNIRQADLLQIDNDYAGAGVMLNCEEFVGYCGDDKPDQLWQRMMDQDQISGPLQMMMLEQWAEMNLLFWMMPVETIVIKRLCFRWAGPDLAHMVVDGIAPGDDSRITVKRTLGTSCDVAEDKHNRQQCPDNEELDWMGLCEAPKSKGRPVGANKSKEKKTKVAEPVRAVIEEPVDEGGQDPEQQLLLDQLDTRLGAGRGSEVLTNWMGAAGNGEDYDMGPDGGVGGGAHDSGDDVSCTTPPSHGHILPSAAFAEIERLPACTGTFGRDPDDAKAHIESEDGTGRYLLKPSAGEPNPRLLLTMKWVSPTCLKMTCALHGSRCLFMVETNCWEQVDREVIELAALAASYKEPETEANAQHHMASARSAMSRVQQLTRREAAAKRKVPVDKAEAEVSKLEKVEKKQMQEARRRDAALQREVKKAEAKAKAATKVLNRVKARENVRE